MQLFKPQNAKKFEKLQNVVLVLVKSNGVKINGAIAFIGEPIINYYFDVFNNFRNVLTDSRHDIRQINIQLIHVVKEVVFSKLRKLSKFLIGFSASQDDFIINVCDVHLNNDIVLEVLGEEFADGVRHDIAPSVTHVAMGVNRRPAHVSENLPALAGDELF